MLRCLLASNNRYYCVPRYVNSRWRGTKHPPPMSENANAVGKSLTSLGTCWLRGGTFLCKLAILGQLILTGKPNITLRICWLDVCTSLGISTIMGQLILAGELNISLGICWCDKCAFLGELAMLGLLALGSSSKQYTWNMFSYLTLSWKAKHYTLQFLLMSALWLFSRTGPWLIKEYAFW